MPEGQYIDLFTSAVGPVVLHVAQPMLEWFRQDNVAPSLAASMAGTAVLILFLYWLFKIVPTLHRLNKPIRFLRRLDRRQFAEKFEEFGALMRKQRFLRHGWDEFIETLPASETGVRTTVEITVRPSVFINLADSEHAGLHLKWIGHLGGIFISLGLLFTFIGLVAALALASDAINDVVRSGTSTAADAQSGQIQIALAQLLKTASFKFWTSIAGLGSGIVIGICERSWINMVSGKFDELNCQLERVTQTVTAEMIARETYAEIRVQSGHLREFTGQFRFNMTQALEDALTRSMPGVMTSSVEQVLTNTMPAVMTNAVGEALLEKMPTVMTDAMTPLVQTLKGMTGEVGTAVTQGAGQEIRAVAEALAALPTQIGDAAGDLRNAALAMTEGMKGILDSASKDVSRTRDTLDGQLEAAGRGLENAAKAIQESLEQVGRSMQATTAEAGNAFGSEIAAAVRRIEATAENNTLAIETVVGRLKFVTEGIAGTLSSESAVTMQAMKEAVGQMADAIRNVTVEMKDVSGRSAEDVTTKFLSAATAMQSAVHENTARIAMAVEQISSAARTAEVGLGAAADDVGRTLQRKGEDAAVQVVEGSAKILTEFGATVEKLWARVGELSAMLGTVENRMGDHVSALEGVTRSTRETETAMAGSARALTTATQPLMRTGELLTQSMTTVARNVETAVGGLAESQRLAGQLATELKKTATDLQTLWNGHVNRFNAVDTAVEGVFKKVIGGTDAYAKMLADYVTKIDENVANISGLLSGNGNCPPPPRMTMLFRLADAASRPGHGLLSGR